jgi:hypothetical protein
VGGCDAQGTHLHDLDASNRFPHLIGDFSQRVTKKKSKLEHPAVIWR